MNANARQLLYMMLLPLVEHFNSDNKAVKKYINYERFGSRSLTR